MRVFSIEELAAYDGKNGAPAYIAFDGRVYDVSSSYQWRGGRHQFRHFAGVAYSGLDGAPHGPDLLERLPVVGLLQPDAAPPLPSSDLPPP